MDSFRLVDSGRSGYDPSMAPPARLPSGQSYYTLESLEGATSLPPLKPGLSTLLPFDRDARMHLDARTRSLLADREALDARARPFAADRDSLIWSNASSSLGTERTMELLGASDERLPLDVRARFSGLNSMDVRTRVPIDDFQARDPRSRPFLEGLSALSHESMRPSLDNRGSISHAMGAQEQRFPPPLRGPPLAGPEHRPLSDIIHSRDYLMGPRGAPYMPPPESLHTPRGNTDIRFSGISKDPALGRRDFRSGVHSSPYFSRAQNERRFSDGGRKPATVRSEDSEIAKKLGKDTFSMKAPAEKPKERPILEQSEGWCAVCKIDCINAKTLRGHLRGKKHKAMEEGPKEKAEETSAKGDSAPVSNQADKKRGNEEKPGDSKSAKRSKTTVSIEINGVLSGVSNDVKKDKVEADGKKTVDSKKMENTAAGQDKRNSSMPFCEVCNIFTTGQANLEAHLKGKKHAARVKELANDV
ncbi:hypothetical protein KP509_33G024700 [Ceratopteris richardii]|uniref:U1-type domain-containing protein n=1 Tax=Ceratopteris richardii TaxID=49495 RepID=A0A8T2QMX9_CERRI|nr:hypothetical protein KP509_33G024700 [Ceratopteris richardii]